MTKVADKQTQSVRLVSILKELECLYIEGSRATKPIFELFVAGELMFKEGDAARLFLLSSETLENELKTNKDTWISYDKCHEVKLSEDGTVEVSIYDGDILYGAREGLRWRATFTGLRSCHLEHFRRELERELYRHAQREFERREEERRQLAIQTLMAEMVESQKNTCMLADVP